jgi:tetratricopeptide (TPR) repeat protein
VIGMKTIGLKAMGGKVTVKQVVLAGALVSLGILSAGCQKLKARDNLNHGVQAFKATQYSQAVNFFKEATDLDPNWEVPRLYLAMSYMSQWIPGAESPENTKFAQSAMDQFMKVLEKKPNDEIATASIASIYFNQKNFDKAEEWNRKMIAIKPDSKEAYYTLGVIAWTKWVSVDLTERQKMGMRRDDPGPLKDKMGKVKTDKEELKAKWIPILDQGITDEQKAIQIDEHYDDAMAYMNLLIRYKADLSDSAEEYKKQSAIADGWVNKAMEARKINTEKKEKAANNGTKQ